MTTIDTLSTLSQMIRHRRKEQGLTQTQLAALSGVGIMFIVDLEKGKETCQIGKALRIVHMLGIKLTAE